MVEMENRGLNHTEGGWPRDVNFHELEQVLRFRKRVEKEEAYSVCLAELAKVTFEWNHKVAVNITFRMLCYK